MTAEQRSHVIWKPLGLWAALLLLVATTFTYAYWPHAPAKPEMALAIAATKALLIAFFFMQLREAAWLVRLAALAGLVWVSFLYLIAFADYLTR